MAILEQSAYIYKGDGVTKAFAAPFPYLEEADIIVRVDGARVEFILENGRVHLEYPPARDIKVEVFRHTDGREPRHTFKHGSPLTPENLDENTRQVLYVTQEVIEGLTNNYEEAVRQAIDDLLGRLRNYTHILNVSEDFTLGAEHSGKWVRVHVPEEDTVVTVTIVPENSEHPTWTESDEVFFEVVGAGYVNFTNTTGTTVNVMQGCAPLLRRNARVAGLKYNGRLSNSWTLYGALEDL